MEDKYLTDPSFLFINMMDRLLKKYILDNLAFMVMESLKKTVEEFLQNCPFKATIILPSKDIWYIFTVFFTGVIFAMIDMHEYL